MAKLIKTSTKGQTEEQWQVFRRNLTLTGKVGGSESSTLLGFNEYNSPLILFYGALNLHPQKRRYNESMFHGRHLEDYVGKMWQYYDGTEDGLIANHDTDNKIKKYRKVNATVENPKYPFMFYNADGEIIYHPDYGKKKGVLELKTMNWMVANKYEGELPPGYLIQLQHGMLVFGHKYGEIAYLKDGQKIGVQTFEAHRGIQDNILTACEAHYNRVLQAKKELDKNKFAPEEELLQIASVFEPSPDNTDAYNDFITERHKNKPNPNMIQGTAEHLVWAEQYKRYSKLEKRVGEHKQLYQNRIKNFMDINSANEMILGEGKKVKWYKQFNVVL